MHLETNRKEQINLDSATRHILEECRMVLPGIQALFGFQLIAVFNQGFGEKLSPFEQKLHFFSILLVTISVALTMAPAAVHRQTQPLSVSERFLRIASILLLWGMLSLAIGICLEIYLIAGIILSNALIAKILALLIFVILMFLWIGLPAWVRRSDGGG
jgi:hypothetical protein